MNHTIKVIHGLEESWNLRISTKMMQASTELRLTWWAVYKI